MKDTCFSEEKKREVSLAVVSLWDLVVTVVVYMRVCVCVCVVTHGNHRRSSPLHVSLFILQPFERLTETNDSASEMSSRPTHKQVEGGGKWDGEEGVKKKKHCNQEVFFCFVVGSVLLRNASELIFGQTGPSHLHGFCSTWKETSIKLCFIPEQPCWFLMFALMHLTLIQCCLICLSVFYHVFVKKCSGKDHHVNRLFFHRCVFYHGCFKMHLWQQHITPQMFFIPSFPSDPLPTYQ